MLLAVIGAAIGAAIAWALYDGRQDAFGNTVFDLTVSPGLIGLGLALGRWRWRCWADCCPPSARRGFPLSMRLRAT